MTRIDYNRGDSLPKLRLHLDMIIWYSYSILLPK